MKFLANTMASRIFSTEEVVSFLMEDVVSFLMEDVVSFLMEDVVSFLMEDVELEFDNPYEPLVEGSNEEFEYLEEQNDSSR